MKKALGLTGLALLVLILILCARASLVKSRQVQAPLVTDLTVDANAAAGRLAGALRFPTVSHEGGAQVEAQAFSICTAIWSRAFRRSTPMTPTWKIVAAVVVRMRALPAGSAASWLFASGPKSHRLASTRRTSSPIRPAPW
jgi:hypothetical protein